jgi:hypothetical protein
MSVNYRLDMAGEMDVLNLLLGLAWLGEVSSDQVQRLWLPTGSTQMCRTILTELVAEGYVTQRMLPSPIIEGSSSAGSPRSQTEDGCSDSDADDSLPLPHQVLWSLTDEACAWLQNDDQYPPRYVSPRPLRVARHDLMSTELVVRMVELGRAAGLSGLYVEREARLDPEKQRPIMDALIMITLGGEYPQSQCVPWTCAPALPTERRVRYALENDRDSEALSVIAGKAVAYAQAGTPAWTERYGKWQVSHAAVVAAERSPPERGAARVAADLVDRALADDH